MLFRIGLNSILNSKSFLDLTLGGAQTFIAYAVVPSCSTCIYTANSLPDNCVDNARHLAPRSARFHREASCVNDASPISYLRSWLHFNLSIFKVENLATNLASDLVFFYQKSSKFQCHLATSESEPGYCTSVRRLMAS